MQDDPLQADLHRRLLDAARGVREHAYAPASGFRVGAAVLAVDGTIHVGCNVENASYGLTVCAERHAVAAAVAAGVRQLVAVAVVTDSEPPAMPCGACRQVLAEFGAAMVVVVGGVLRGAAARLVTTLPELLPRPFTFGSLRK